MLKLITHSADIARLVQASIIDRNKPASALMPFTSFRLGNDRVVGERLVEACRTSEKIAAADALRELTGCSINDAVEFLDKNCPVWNLRL